MKKLSLILLAAACLASCRGEALRDDFAEMGGVRCVVKGRSTLVYNPVSCQMSFNRERREFRVCRDNMADFYSLKLSAIPAENGQKLSGDVQWTTSDNLNRKKNVGFEVVRNEAGKFWLWSGALRLGVIVQVLD